MKLENIRTTLQTMEGEDLKDGRGDALTMGSAIAGCLGATKAKNGRDQIFAYKLGCKLVDKNMTNLDVDEYELSLINESLDGPINYGNTILGQIREYLKELEKDKE